MTPRDAVRSCLAQGPRTAEQVAAETGLAIDRVRVILCEIEADDGPISKRKMYVYRMPGGTCDWPGCDQRLRATNATGYCSCHVKAAAREQWGQFTDAEKRRFLDEFCDGFDPDAGQLELEAVVVP